MYAHSHERSHLRGSGNRSHACRITLTVILIVIFAVLLGVSFKDVEADEMVLASRSIILKLERNLACKDSAVQALRWHTLSKQVAPDVYEQVRAHTCASCRNGRRTVSDWWE
jgi:hypothetical protein